MRLNTKQPKKKEEGIFLMKKDTLGLEKKKEKKEATSFNMVRNKSFYFKQRWGRTKLELFVGSIFHWLINLLLLCPIICIGKVDQLNYLIMITSDKRIYHPCTSLSPVENYWAFPDEDEAYKVASILMWLLTLLTTISAVLELILLYLFTIF